MCGIIGALNCHAHQSSVNDEVAEIFEDQRSRGTEGFGLVFIDEKNKVHVKRATDEIKFLVDLNLNQSTMIFAHHRNPTSTVNYIDQTHPIEVKHKDLKFDYLVMHNGIINDKEELREEHKKLGFEYTTEYESTREEWRGAQKVVITDIKYNDSEVFAIEIARFLDGNIKKITKLYGSIASIILQIDKKDRTLERVYVYSNGQPLRLSQNRKVIRINSEGKGELIKENTMYSFDDDCVIESEELTIPMHKPELATAKEGTVVTHRGYFDDDDFVDDNLENFATDENLNKYLNKAHEQVKDEIFDYFNSLITPSGVLLEQEELTTSVRKILKLMREALKKSEEFALEESISNPLAEEDPLTGSELAAF